MLLKKGDSGIAVTYLQYGLHIMCCSPNGFDGNFGTGVIKMVNPEDSNNGASESAALKSFESAYAANFAPNATVNDTATALGLVLLLGFACSNANINSATGLCNFATFVLE